MTVFDLLDDLSKALLIVVLASNEIEIPWSILFVVVFTFDLEAQSEGSFLSIVRIAYLFEIVDLFRSSKDDH